MYGGANPRGKNSRKQPKAADFVRPFSTIAEERLFAQVQQLHPTWTIPLLTAEFNVRAHEVVKQAHQDGRILMQHERLFL